MQWVNEAKIWMLEEEVKELKNQIKELQKDLENTKKDEKINFREMNFTIKSSAERMQEYW